MRCGSLRLSSFAVESLWESVAKTTVAKKLACTDGQRSANKGDIMTKLISPLDLADVEFF